jgi:hypothetical protein
LDRGLKDVTLCGMLACRDLRVDAFLSRGNESAILGNDVGSSNYAQIKALILFLQKYIPVNSAHARVRRRKHPISLNARAIETTP